MCVLICRVGEQPLLAANRDERYERPFVAPALWEAPTPFWAPRDEEEGGTWIGVNRNGLIVGITNRSRLDELPERASRGHLVTGMLGAGDLDEAFDWLGAELQRAERNPCQLFGMQGERAIVCRVGPDELLLSRLAPGPGVGVG